MMYSFMREVVEKIFRNLLKKLDFHLTKSKKLEEMGMTVIPTYAPTTASLVKL